jgi:hypothetical protein
MSEIGLPEPAPEHQKKHGRARLIEPLLSSVPTLIGVLVGAVTSHVAEVQRVDFEREDRFRHEQVERVAAVAHGFDSLAEPLSTMIAAVQTRKPALCQYMPMVAAAEIRLRNAGLLHGRLFAPGVVDPNGTAEYGREINALTTSSDPGQKSSANLLKAMIGLYTAMLTNVETADAEFVKNREAFQATLMFEVKVYFPDRIRKDVSATMDAYHVIGKQATSVQAPNALCALDDTGLGNRLLALNVNAAREMTEFAQTLEPALSDESIGGKS